ncbi:MAG: flagellar export protein FliJ [Actinomycetota bacterium]|jgi:flagellar FliJ protein|nr:flagellar export protein FliJ [Actinomycetota bacterium]MDI7252738.1 flagellar export protein FliJ [Actinomycetota bacterium]
MKKFSFRLESVRRLRTAQEEERKRIFGAAARRYHEEREALHALTERERKARERLARELSSGCASGVLAAMNEFLRGNAVRIKAQVERTEEARARMEEERRLLAEASKERKVVDRLRERALERHRYESSREEQGFLDEVAGVRFVLGGNLPAAGRKWTERDGT